jgi:hypothetical protein
MAFRISTHACLRLRYRWPRRKLLRTPRSCSLEPPRLVQQTIGEADSVGPGVYGQRYFDSPRAGACSITGEPAWAAIGSSLNFGHWVGIGSIFALGHWVGIGCNFGFGN